MSPDQPNNPLHGVTLKAIVEDLVERHGFPALAERIPLRCFTHDPSVKSTLKLLRKTPWAREKVERLWLEEQRRAERKRKRNQLRAARRATKAALQGRDEPQPGAGDKAES